MCESSVSHGMSSQFSSDAASQVVRVFATHPRLGRLTYLAPAIDRQHGRDGMFENKLHTCARLQQNYKLVKGGQLTTQSDAVHEEHIYGGLIPYERLQKIVLYVSGCGHVRGQSDRSFDGTGERY